MTINNLYSLLNKHFNFDECENWDNSGFFNINKSYEVKKAIVCLDINEQVLEVSISNNIKLIISHHPFYIEENDLKKPYYKKLYNLIKKNNISILSLHTNYDKGRYGMNYQLLKKLDLCNIKRYDNSEYMFCGELKKEMEYKAFLEFVKSKYDLRYLTINENDERFIKNKMVNKVAVIGGSGSNSITDIKIKDKIDVFLTGEVKWHVYDIALHTNVSVVDIGHISEKIFIEHISAFLNKENIETLCVWPTYKKISII